MEGDNGRKQGKGHQGTCMKDTGTNPKGKGGQRGCGGVKMETSVLEQQ